MPVYVDNPKTSEVGTVWLRRIGRVLLAETGHRGRALSITLVTDAEISALNRAYRHKDRATDVLSFPQLEGGPVPAGGPVGDIVISYQTADRQARVQGIGLRGEVQRLLVHGYLHLLGYDHVHGGRQAGKMKREEERLAAICDAQVP